MHGANPISGVDEAVVTGGRDRGDSASLRVVVVTELDELAGMTRQWERLLASAHRATEFNTPAAVLTWYRWFGRLTSGVYVPTVWRGDKLVGLAPLSLTRLGPPIAGFRLLNTVGAEHGYYGEPLLAADHEPVAQAIVDHLAHLVRGGTAVVNLRRLRSNGPTATALHNRADLTCHTTDDHVRSLVRFDQMTDPDAYFARVGRKHQIPRRSRRLAERFDHIEYLAHDPEPDTALDTMRDMLRRRFAPTDGPELFATPGREAFTRELTRQMLKSGHARISSLIADGRRIVVSLDFALHPRTFSITTAVEPELVKLSLGHIELFKALRYAYDSGLTEVDLGSATFSYKDKWANATAHYTSVAVTATGWRGTIANRAGRAALSYRARRLYRHGRETHATTESQ